MNFWKRLLPAVVLAVMALVMPAIPGISPALIVRAETFSFQPEDPDKHEYAFEDESVEINLKGTDYDYSYSNYMAFYDAVRYESSNANVAMSLSNGLATDHLFCTVNFCGEGDTVITAIKDNTVIGSFAITVKAGDLELVEDHSSTVLGGSDTDGYQTLTFNHPIASVTSSDASVCKAGTTCYSLQEDTQDYNSSDLGEVRQCIIWPMKPGEVTLTIKDTLGKTLEHTIKVNQSWFKSYMKNPETNCFLYWATPHEDTDVYEIWTDKNLSHEMTDVMVRARYGTKVTLKIGKKKYKTVTADQYNIARIKKVSQAKIGTKVTLTCKLGGVTEKRTGKIYKRTKINTEEFDLSKKSGWVMFYHLAKGDVLKVIVDKKTIKKVTIKKAAKHYTLDFKLKKKLKKKQKIKFTAYNKFGQKLLSKTETR